MIPNNVYSIVQTNECIIHVYIYICKYIYIHYSKLYLYLLQSYSTNYTCLLHQSFKGNIPYISTPKLHPIWPAGPRSRIVTSRTRQARRSEGALLRMPSRSIAQACSETWRFQPWKMKLEHNNGGLEDDFPFLLGSMLSFHVFSGVSHFWKCWFWWSGKPLKI